MSPSAALSSDGSICSRSKTMLTPSKKRKTTATTPETPTPTKVNDDLRLCAELGGLAMVTARHPKFKALYGLVLQQETLSSEPGPGPPKILAIDVEMLDDDGTPRPVSAAVVAYPERRVVFSGLVAPCEHWESREFRNWKTEFHGIDRETLMKGPVATIKDVQSLVASEWHDLCFFCGHRLAGDLQCLGIGGPALRRRIIDSMLTHWNAGAPSLNGLVAAIPRTFEKDHDAEVDADKAYAVLQDDLSTLSSLAASLRPPASTAHRVVLQIPAADVGRFIGKRGATFNAIQASCTDVLFDLASGTAEKKKSNFRRLDLQAESSDALLNALTVIQASVPTLGTLCRDARQTFLDDHPPPSS